MKVGNLYINPSLYPQELIFNAGLDLVGLVLVLDLVSPVLAGHFLSLSL